MNTTLIEYPGKNATNKKPNASGNKCPWKFLDARLDIFSQSRHGGREDSHWETGHDSNSSQAT